MDSIQEKTQLDNKLVCRQLAGSNKKRLLNTGIKLRKPRKHAWKITENQQYISFLQNHQHLMTDIYSRKVNKIFRKMSEAIGTRTPSQVKSHHQKLQMRYKTITRILIRVKQYIKLLKNKIEMKQEDSTSFSPTDKTNNEVLTSQSQLSDLTTRYLKQRPINQGGKSPEKQYNTKDWEAYFDFE